jgi:EpsD family peptidyl-prolyl cis-trans isomerase
MTNKTKASKAIVLPGLLLLSAGGGKEPGKSSGQVIAKVNDDEISIHQVNFVLSRTNGINQDNVEIAKKQIGNALVDQALLNQQAIADKMDRDPEIMLAIEKAKRQVWARTWLDKTIRGANKSTVQKNEQYYQAHPRYLPNTKSIN